MKQFLINIIVLFISEISEKEFENKASMDNFLVIIRLLDHQLGNLSSKSVFYFNCYIMCFFKLIL